MGEQILAIAGAQDMDTGGYELSVLEDIELFWERPRMELHPVFRPVIDTPFSPTAFNCLEKGGG